LHISKEASENNLKLRILNNKMLVEQHKREENEKMLEKEEEILRELERKKEIVKEIQMDKDNFLNGKKSHIKKMHDEHLIQIKVLNIN
jgi:hypothetical protein